jgi:methyl-accepting chemotaxis protein
VKIRKLKIGQRLQLYIMVVASVVILFAIGYISVKNLGRELRAATKLIDTSAISYAEDISNTLNQHLAKVRTLAQAFYVQNELPAEEWKEVIVSMHRQIYDNNPDFHALWDSWEYSHIDPEWELPYGRMLNYHFRKEGEVGFQVLERSIDGDPELYGKAKQAGREMIWEPYPDQLEVGATGTTLMTTLTVPMFFNNRYIGLVGVDITLAQLQDLISQIKPFEDSYAFLVSHQGLYAAHPNSLLLEKTIAENLYDDNLSYQITEKILQGQTFSFSSSNEKNTEYYYTFVPVIIGETQTPWSLGIAVPYNSIRKEADRALIMSLLIGILGIFIVAMVVWKLARDISGPITLITGIIQRLSRGEINGSMKLSLKTGDEFEQMADAFNTSIDGLERKTLFAQSIGQGDLDAKLTMASEHDVLGKSLIDMQNDLKKAHDEELTRKEEDRIRRWSTEGFAMFSEILRQNNSNLETLSFDVIKNLVKYLEANQGGIFVLNNDDQNDIFLELMACFAYDRKKFMGKKILPGEGLVGSCFKEGKTIYLTQIPQSYLSITSGLGDASPEALIIVPLMLNDEVFGVMEIASFNAFQPYQIDFIERIGESVASTVSSVRISQTTTLLLEKSQQQAEEMKAQEEEMRQNMEELHATQEEMERKSQEMEGVFKALDSSSCVIEYNLDGKITYISDSYLKLLNIKRSDALGAAHADKIEFSDQQKVDYQRFWNDLKNGLSRHQEAKIVVDDKVFWFSEVYTPIKDQAGNVLKIFKIAYDITEVKLLSEKLKEENLILKNQIDNWSTKK